MINTVMKKIFLFFISGFICSNALGSEQYFYSGTNYSGYSINFDKPIVVIENGADIYPEDNIKLMTNVVLYNSGNVHGTIDTNGQNLIVHNSGNISGGIVVKPSDALTQVIDSESEFVKFDVSGNNFNVNINNISNLDLDRMKSLGAEKYNIYNSSIVINDYSDLRDWGDTDIHLLELQGIYIKNADTIKSGEYISFLTDDDINIFFIESNKLYNPELKLMPDGVVLNIVRETDYRKIFDDKRGEILANIRATDPNDKLLMNMDSAETMQGLTNIMSDSYRFNLSKLVRPVKVANNFLVFDSLRNRDNTGVGVNASLYSGDKVRGAGANIYSGLNVNQDIFNIGFNFNRVLYSDNNNEFDVDMYGFNINADIDLANNYWLNAGLIGNITKYNADNIYYNDDIKNNPNGYSGDIIIDGGYDYVINDNWSVSPFAGFVFEHESVLGYNDSEINMRAGADIRYSYVFDNMHYVYDGFCSVATNAVFGSMKFGIQSDTDNFGANVGIDILKTDIDLNYRLSINGNLMF